MNQQEPNNGDSRGAYLEILAALCLMKDGAEARDLFAFLSAHDQQKLEQISKSSPHQKESDVKEFLNRFQKVKKIKSFSLLDEIHPGWILDKLEDESPRVLGLLCRFLPGDRARELIQYLPLSIRQKLPKLNESYRVSPDILDIVKRLVEKKLSYAIYPPEDSSFSFAHIAWMKPDDLRKLFYDLGLDEVRKAFFRVEPTTLRTFLSRFPTHEAKEIRQRIEHGGAVSLAKKQESQKHLLLLHLEHFSAEELILEIGYSVFARALMVEEKKWADVICHKMEPKEGVRFKRLVQESISQVADHLGIQGIQERKEAILQRVSVLMDKKSICRYWKDGKISPEHGTIKTH